MPIKGPDIGLLHPYIPSETALLDWLKPHIDDDLLHEIAAADYSFAAEYFAALKPIRDKQNILTFHDLKHEVWRDMTKEVLLDPNKLFSEPTDAAIRNIANRLAWEAG